MRCFETLRYDIKNGIRRNWLFVIVPLYTLLICSQCRTMLEFWDVTGTWGVYIAYFFKGMQAISRQTLDGGFQLPLFWVVGLVLPLLITLNYPFKDLKTIGPQMLLRSRCRVKWWLSKCGWNFLSSVLYFFLLYVTMVVRCFFWGEEISLVLPLEAMLAVFYEAEITDAVGELSMYRLVLELVVLPFLTVVALNMFEMLLSLIIRPVYSFVISVALIVASSYITSPILIGNYANLARYGSFINEGLNGQNGLLICLSTIFFAVILGAFVFRQRDILPDYKEF